MRRAPQISGMFHWDSDPSERLKTTGFNSSLTEPDLENGRSQAILIPRSPLVTNNANYFQAVRVSPYSPL